MLNLFIFRHAKAEPHQLNDFERKLNTKGKNDSFRIASHIKELSLQPDLIISSPAPRALQTAEIFKNTVNPEIPLLEDMAFYEAGAKVLFEKIKIIDKSIKSLMLVGHNPVLLDLANLVCETKVEWLPKCALLSLEFEVKDWADLKKKSGKIRFFTHPKEFIYFDATELKKS